MVRNGQTDVLAFIDTRMKNAVPSETYRCADRCPLPLGYLTPGKEREIGVRSYERTAPHDLGAARSLYTTCVWAWRGRKGAV